MLISRIKKKKRAIISVLLRRSPVKLPAVASSCLAPSRRDIFPFLCCSLLLQLFLICGSEPRAPKRVSATTDWYWVTAQLRRENVCCYIGSIRFFRDVTENRLFVISGWGVICDFYMHMHALHQQQPGTKSHVSLPHDSCPHSSEKPQHNPLPDRI